MAAAETEPGARADADGGAGPGRLGELYTHLADLRARHEQLRERINTLGGLDDRGHDESTAESEAAATGPHLSEQVQRAQHLRRELAETARAMARVEDEVAAVLERLAAASPDRAGHLRGLAEQARENAELERARAGEYEAE